MPIFAVTAALPGRAPEMLAAAGEVRSGPDAGRMDRGDLLALVEGVDVAVTMLYDRVDDELLDAAAPGAFALHDLPAHAGEEITAEVLYGARQRIWDQAENRRHAQKALLELLVSAQQDEG